MRPPGPPTGKSASFRSCVRARGLVVRWEWRSKSAATFSLFPFVSPRPSLFPSGAKVSSSEFKRVQMRSSEFKRVRVSSSEFK